MSASKKSKAQLRYENLAALAATQMQMAERALKHALKSLSRAQSRAHDAQARIDAWAQKYDDAFVKSRRFPAKKPSACTVWSGGGNRKAPVTTVPKPLRKYPMGARRMPLTPYEEQRDEQARARLRKGGAS